MSYGALRLLDAGRKPLSSLTRMRPLEVDLSAYARDWEREAARIEAAA